MKIGLRRLRARGRDEAGFSIIELMLALSVFAVMMVATSATLSGAFGTTRLNRNRSIAAHVASREMDLVRSSDPTTLPVGLVQSTVNVDGVLYTVKRESAWVSEDATTSPCDGPSGSQVAFLRVAVSVTWPKMGQTAPVRSQTIMATPNGTYSPYTGHISVKVLDGSAVPVQGQLVNLSGPEIDSQTTASDGCAFFAFLAPGTYTIELSTTGKVDGQGISPATQAAGVTVGQKTSVVFDYDLAASLELSLVGEFGGTAPSDVAVTVANTHLLPTGTKVVPGTGTPRTVGSLFPYSDGYQVWAGSCADADPEAVGGGGAPLYPGATRQPPLAVSPGGTTTGTVDLASANLIVERNAVPQPGLTVTAHHDPDSVCASGSVLTLGTTDAAGVVQAALPYGTWRFEVTGQSPSGSWPTQVLSPTDASASTVQVDIL